MKKGFTLVELLIIISLLSMILALAFMTTYSLVFDTALRDQTRNVESALRKAQTVAITGRGENDAGVKVKEKEFVIFQGSSYEGRTTPYDRTVYFPVTMTLEGTDEFVFQKESGLLLFAEDEASLTLSYGGDSKVITVNSQGKIESDI